MITRSVLRSISSAILVALTIFLFYMVKPDNIFVTDAIWAPHVTVSLIYDRDLYLDEFYQWIEQSDLYFYATIKQEGNILSNFPIGGPALTVPQMIVMDAVLSRLTQTNLREYLITHSPLDPLVLKLQLVNASLFVALSAGVMYLIGREYLNIPFSLILTATYAFGTSAYSTASRAMWQHGPSMLMLSISLLFLIKARRHPNLIMVMGLPVAISYIVRPTNSISVLVITLYVLICYRRHFIGYLLFAFLPAVPFILMNLNLYGWILSPYYAASRLELLLFGKALPGNLISPGRGLFIFSPVFLLVPLGISFKAIKKQWAALDWAIISIITLHWLAISMFLHWWGGHSFGPRFFSDVLPYLAYFLIPVLETLQSPGGSTSVRASLGTVFGVLALISIAIHYRGATSVSTAMWNSVPIDVDKSPARIWDWSDLQFLRGIGSDLVVLTPDRINLEPVGDSSPQLSYFELSRLTDSPVGLVVRLPDRVNLAEHIAWLFDLDPLPGGGKIGRLLKPISAPIWRFDIEIDTTNTIAGDSLNAIEIVASIPTPADEIRGQETHIIPVSILSGPDHLISLPPDIRVDCPVGGSGALYGLFGTGWYSQESAGDASWRWTVSPTYLYIWSDNKQDVTIEVAISALHDSEASNGLGDDGTFHVFFPDGAKTTLAGQVAQSLRFDTPLQVGWNTIIFELEAGNFRPADLVPGHYEMRELSFSIDEITLTGTCAIPTIHP